MKRLILAAISGLILSSCQKKQEKITTPQSFEVMEHSSWPAEAFKHNYTIQFPPGYKGSMVGFEGNILNKVNATHTTSVGYAYCNGLYCSDFRDTLFTPSFTSILTIPGYNQTPVLLSSKIEFTKNNQLIGVLYHNNDATTMGVLFWKDDNFFKEAASILCVNQDLPEVIDILRTIKRK